MNTFHLSIITPEQQDAFEDIPSFRDFLRSSVYDMPAPAEWTRIISK